MGGRGAAAQVGDSWENPWAEARAYYGAQDFPTALRFAIEAAQRDPGELRYYLAIARIYFQLGQHENATWYYDLYLEAMRGRPFTGPASYNPELARAERDSAAQARGDRAAEPSVQPQAERDVREALLARIEGGPALTETGGGAWATWVSLRRIGYANPDLAELVRLLVEALRREADTAFDPASPRVPHLTIAGWTAQAQRYEYARQAIRRPDAFDGTRNAEELPPLPAGWHFAMGMVEYLQQNHERAAAHFDDAISQDPALLPAHTARLNAWLAAWQRDDAALDAALRSFTQRVTDPTLRSFYTAAVHARRERWSDAAAALTDLLTPPAPAD